jgi:hypothetical protein
VNLAVPLPCIRRCLTGNANERSVRNRPVDICESGSASVYANSESVGEVSYFTLDPSHTSNFWEFFRVDFGRFCIDGKS